MCLACSTPYDPTKADAFSERLLVMLNHGMATLMISAGHRTGLFDVMADGQPRTSSQLASDAGLNERYVREWLGAMVTSGIVICDPADATHRLPSEHARWLSRKSATTNMAVYSQYLAVLAQVEEPVLECFRNGGGVPYSAFARFSEVMAEDSGQSVVPIIADQVVRLFPGLHDELCKGIDVVDVGCGKGLALTELARAYPNSRFHGYDFLKSVVEEANVRAAAAGLYNLRFECRNLTGWDEQQAFDWVLALDAIHDQARPDLVLKNIRRALRPGGWFLMQDIDASSEPTDNINHPLGTVFYTISTFHCMTVSLAENGMGLGTAWGVQRAETMLREAGFDQIRIHRFPHDVQNAYFLMQT